MPSRHLCEHEQEIITHGAARWQLSNDGRKAMTNLDSVLKSRDITLLINERLYCFHRHRWKTGELPLGREGEMQGLRLLRVWLGVRPLENPL